MPYDDPDPTDPMTLTGVEILVDSPDAVREMAECFVEEYIRLGLSPDAIIQLFDGGEFAGPTLAIRQIGRESIEAIIQEQFLIRGPRGLRVQVDRTPVGGLSLPVMER